LKAPNKKSTLKSSGINTGIKKSYGTNEAFKKEENKRATKGTFNKADLFIETPERLEIDTDLGNELIRVPPKTTSNADLEMLRRKFSHDPNATETIFELFRKKQLQGGIDARNYYGNHTQKSDMEESREGIDIGKALNGLKDRIAGMLGRYKDDRERMGKTQTRKNQN